MPLDEEVPTNEEKNAPLKQRKKICYFTAISLYNVIMVADGRRHAAITSTGDELFRGVKINDLD